MEIPKCNKNEYLDAYKNKNLCVAMPTHPIVSLVYWET